MLFIVVGMRTAEGREHPIRCSFFFLSNQSILVAGMRTAGGREHYIPYENLFSSSQICQIKRTPENSSHFPHFFPSTFYLLQTHRLRLGVFVLIDKAVTTTLTAAIINSNLPWLFQLLKKNRLVLIKLSLSTLLSTQ